MELYTDKKWLNLLQGWQRIGHIGRSATSVVRRGEAGRGEVPRDGRWTDRQCDSSQIRKGSGAVK